MNDMARRMVMDRQRRMQQDSARRARDYGMEDYARGGNRGMDYAGGGNRAGGRRGMDYEMDGRRGRRGMDYADYDMRLSDEIGTEPEYPQEMMWDGKQGVKGTGPYGIGGRLYSRGRDYGYEDGADYEMDGRRRRNADYADYEMDGGHASGLMKLKKKDFMRWEKQIENADGTKGKHFDPEQIKKTAEQIGVKYRGFDEKELCMTANMLYSDYCQVLKNIIPPDKELIAYVKLALAWLEDPDAPIEGSEKLALYYWCIVSDDE